MVGKLKEARRSHNVIVHQGQFIVVGGYHWTDITTERCTLDDNSIECTSTDPKLLGYGYYPEMMSVPQNYCSK